jgi:hypothetical protein
MFYLKPPRHISTLPKRMVLPDRIELSTSPLPMECSTTELRQHARDLDFKNRPKRPHMARRSLPQALKRRKHASPSKLAINRGFGRSLLLQPGQLRAGQVPYRCGD